MQSNIDPRLESELLQQLSGQGRERERQRDRETERQRDRERERVRAIRAAAGGLTLRLTRRQADARPGLPVSRERRLPVRVSVAPSHAVCLYAPWPRHGDAAESIHVCMAALPVISLAFYHSYGTKGPKIRRSVP